MLYFYISFNRNKKFATIRHIPWALNTPKMHTFLVNLVSAQGTCLIAANVVLPRWEGANSATPNLSAGFEGPFRSAEKGEEMKEGKGRKRRR